MKFFFSLLPFLLFLYSEALEKPLVYTSVGALQGVEDQTALGKKIYKFLGVPYAKPPIKELRFEEPQPVEKWSGVREAVKVSAACLQHLLNYDIPESELITGKEDCLYINIYTPTLSNETLLPVLVYFHGGGFMYGTGNIFSPHFILDRSDFVFISVNYRLGPLGFLSTGDEVVPGNNGLKDQVVALKWIQENVLYFRGDKNEVTISGLSAGGASVHLHYLSPLSKGLFSRGISMSGSAYCPWVLAEESPQKAKMLAGSVGCDTSDSLQMVQCLKKVSGKKILKQLKPLFWPWLHLPFTPVGVVVESSGKNPFLTDHPYRLISEGKVADLPWLSSVTTEEGLFPGAAFIDRENLLKEFNDNFDNIAPHLLDYNYTVSPENLKYVTKKIRKFYFGNEEISIENSNQVVQMIGDRLFVVDMERASRDQAAVTKSPVYFYMFGYPGKYSISQFFTKDNSSIFGASHGDDLTYVVTRPIFTPLETYEDKSMMMKMTNIWVSFIRSGIPSPGPNVEWDELDKTPARKGNIKYLLIDDTGDMDLVSFPEMGQRWFWETLPFNELQAPEVKHLKDEL